MAPAGVAWVELKNTDAIFGGKRLAARGVQHHIPVNRGWRAVVTLKFGCHIAESVLTHIEVGAIEPVCIGVLVWDEHLGHGNLVGDRPEVALGDNTNIIENRALARVKAKMELPVLPVDLTPRDGEISSLALLDGDRLQCRSRVEGTLVKLDDLKVVGWCVSPSKRVCDFDELQILNIKQDADTFNWSRIGTGRREKAQATLTPNVEAIKADKSVIDRVCKIREKTPDSARQAETV